MRAVIIGIIASLALCGCPETTKYCDDCCTIWAEDGCWDYDTCMEECRDEKDWLKPYLDCLERADDCWDMEDCG